MDTLAERLKTTLKDRRVSQTALAKALGVNPQQIQAVCSGKIQRPSNIVDIARHLSVSPFWLQEGRGPRDLLLDDNFLMPAGKIPLIGWEEIGTSRYDKASWINPPTPVSQSAFALTIQGYSMVGEHTAFPPGSIIIVDPAREPKETCFVVVRIDGVPSLRRYTKEAGKIFLHLLNTQYPNAICELKDADVIVGTVIGMYQPLL